RLCAPGASPLACRPGADLPPLFRPEGFAVPAPELRPLLDEEGGLPHPDEPGGHRGSVRAQQVDAPSLLLDARDLPALRQVQDEDRRWAMEGLRPPSRLEPRSRREPPG